MTSTTRWEVPNNATSVTSQIRYDIAGSPVAQIDPLGRKVRIGYADVFDTTGNPTTFAYPTTITDPAGTSLGDSLHSSTVKYRYDIGANVEATSPAPAGNTLGKKTTRIFDPVGRLQKETIVNSGAYTRYEYPNNGVQSKVFSTIIDTNNNGADALDEVLSESWSDGAGRVRRSRTPHTFDGAGNPLTWAGTIVEYDILGRVSRSSVPTEVSVPDPNNPDTWAPTGDDATRGWLWSYQYYDWKGRVIRTVPTDSNGTDDKDTLITYEGCGCAGGQITTIRGPKTEAIDMAGIPQTAKRRTQKVYEDILGRAFKTEAWDLDGASIYSTVRTKFNGRDQSLLTTEYQGAEGSGTFQETTATFDGHGRLASSHKPEQRDTNNVLKYTTYSYNADDSIQSVTDGRGAVTNYTYNPTTGLLSQMSWTVPQGSNIQATPSVLFTYDNVGNRLTMADGLGSVNYEYNQLSQMTAETRTFNDTLPDKPAGNYRIGYAYTLGGQVKSYTDPYGDQIDNTRDKKGRIATVTGSLYSTTTNYLSNPAYRAWGALKHVEYGSGQQMNATFNTRLSADSFVVNTISSPSTKIFDRTYQYYPDGKLKLIDENINSTTDKYDRLFKYDHVGRVKEAKSGIEAFGQTETDLTRLPYRQSYTYSALGHLTARASTLWNYAGDWGFSRTVVNNRITDTGNTYDADGRQTLGDGIPFTFDAAGLMATTEQAAGANSYEMIITNDGLGNEGKRSQRLWDSQTNSYGLWDSKYFVYSTVFGRILTEATKTGKKWRTFVLADGGVIARQVADESGNKKVGFEYRDASGLSGRASINSALSGFDHGILKEELDGLGNNVGLQAQTTPAQTRNEMSPLDRAVFDKIGMGQCSEGGILGPCSIVEGLEASADYLTHADPYPIELNGRPRRNRNNPFMIAREIMNATGSNGLFTNSLVPDSLKRSPRSFQFEPSLFYDLIGQQPSPAKSLKTEPADRTISQDCISALSDLGIWERVKQLLERPPLFDIETMSGLYGSLRLPGSDFFGSRASEDSASFYLGKNAQPGETLGEAFDRLVVGRESFNKQKGQVSGAVTVRNPGGDGGLIYYRGSRTNFEQDIYLLLHEVVHVVFPTTISPGKELDLDVVLAAELTLKKLDQESAADAVSRFFISKCDPSLRTFGMLPDSESK